MDSIYYGSILTFRPGPDSGIIHGNRIPKPGISIEKRHADVRSTPLFTSTGDHPISNNEEKLPCIGVIGRRNRIESRPQGFLTLGITSHQTDSEKFCTYLCETHDWWIDQGVAGC